MIFTPFSGPVLWIGEEKIMIDSLLPRASSLVRLIEQLLTPTSAVRLGDEKALEILTARESKTAQFSRCDEPLAFLSSLGLCRIQSRETRF
jgi:hypothetical protein